MMAVSGNGNVVTTGGGGFTACSPQRARTSHRGLPKPLLGGPRAGRPSPQRQGRHPQACRKDVTAEHRPAPRRAPGCLPAARRRHGAEAGCRGQHRRRSTRDRRLPPRSGPTRGRALAPPWSETPASAKPPEPICFPTPVWRRRWGAAVAPSTRSGVPRQTLYPVWPVPCPMPRAPQKQREAQLPLRARRVVGIVDVNTEARRPTQCGNDPLQGRRREQRMTAAPFQSREQLAEGRLFHFDAERAQQDDQPVLQGAAHRSDVTTGRLASSSTTRAGRP